MAMAVTMTLNPQEKQDIVDLYLKVGSVRDVWANTVYTPEVIIAALREAKVLRRPPRVPHYKGSAPTNVPELLALARSLEPGYNYPSVSRLWTIQQDSWVQRCADAVYRRLVVHNLDGTLAELTRDVLDALSHSNHIREVVEASEHALSTESRTFVIETYCRAFGLASLALAAERHVFQREREALLQSVQEIYGAVAHIVPKSTKGVNPQQRE